ncbi:TPA: S8 family serine peptidase [Stenotrophomonas maltophilia]|uniref:S8 family serine peptidase n=1 Tax=Stenotrophomonas TaxID=40323 RepID=UPI00138FA040|nr:MULTISPECIES: S8 family serine peptidase [Stenotrophomonas]HDS1137215.1 S8 family serine peptidase [Stenotrophomonas maltophilia]HDS1146352.1 S8 family serine peptidase [Stenotrophomonas maltophilia]HDS1159833.1 S8 family serine peptidase [Stenotrophomonas maltophilia]HEL5400961.1 S8 family serine peptidase [Stenotrophomonas maltophilia]
MRNALYCRSLRTIRMNPTPLAAALGFAVLVAPLVSAHASETYEQWLQQRQLQTAWSSSYANSKPLNAGTSGAPSSQASDPPTIMGTLGDPASWRTEEFNRDWGLAAIKAEYAYARGLTGKGVRLGVTDSGTALEHPEFAGKDHRAFIMASLRGDGSRCDQMILGGPDSCYYKKGDDAEIDGVASGPTAPGAPKPKFSFSLQSHGTHVAGTVAANRGVKGTHGVASAQIWALPISLATR